MSNPSVVIIGPGAMGLFHAARLTEAGLSVTLLHHDARRARLIASSGITVERAEGTANIPVPCRADPRKLDAPDLIVIFVKAYHTLLAAQSAALIPGEAPVLTLQNGLGNWEALAERLPLARILAGTTSSGATLLAEGHVREAGVGVIRLGAPNAPAATAERAAALLRCGGLSVEAVADIEPVLWHKAMINAAVNPLTALSGLPNGEMWADPGLRAQAIALAEEVLMVADECGIALRPLLGDRSPADILADICRLTADNRTSMLQDITFGRSTEIDAINGEIARRARDCGFRAPLCEQIVKKVHALPRGE